MASLVDVVEAAYRIEGDDERWLTGICDAALPRFDRGLGIYAFRFDAGHVEDFEIRGFASTDGAVVDPKLVERWHAMLSPNEVRRIYRSPRALAPISWRMGVKDHPLMSRLCTAIGVGDQLTLRAIDPTLEGLTLCSPTPESVFPSRREAHTWTLVATHIVAGYRIRRGLQTSAIEGAEAVLDPDGETRHAEGPAKSGDARERLRAAARAVDRARSRKGRADDEEALRLWRGLVAGRWSLVDHFESDGRRYLVARENAPETPDPRALTTRERQVAGFAALGMMNKEIAYGLGLSESSVSTALTSVRRKLRARTRSDLIRVLQPDVTEEQLP